MKKFLLFLSLNLLLHFPFLNLPPSGTHVWRQCNTLAMSRNFAEEGMNIVEPKIDRRNETNGITGSHFPLYEWTLASISKVFGFSDALARVFSLLIFTFGMLAFYKLLLLFNVPSFLAQGGAFLLLSIPELYYHGINAMPDVLALTLALWAMVYWLVWQKNKKGVQLLLALLFSLGAGLIKFQFLMLPLATLVFIPFNVKSIVKNGLIWLGIGGLVFSWYAYALALTKSSNLKEFGLWIEPISNATKWTTFLENLSMDAPEVLVGWPLLLCLIYLIFKTIRTWKWGRMAWFILAWLFMFICFYVVAIERMKNHTYYFMPVIPLIIVVAIVLMKNIRISPRLLMLVLILNYTWALVRIIPSRWVESKRQIPVEFSDANMRKAFNEVLPINSKCVVGPDISGCIFFYFTHTKGYSFEFVEELVKVKQDRIDIDNMRAAGIQYLIIKDGNILQPYLPAIHLKRKLKTIGSFEIWEL